MSAVAISFAGNNLQTANIITQSIVHASLPAKRAQTYALGHANASVIPFVEYPSKPITVTGVLQSDSIADLDALIDTFNSYLLANGGDLDIAYASGTRRYICTATASEIDRPGNLNWANFSITFIALQPFGQDTTATTIVNDTAQTSSSYNYSYTFLGTAPTQLPLITITLTSVTDTSGGYISVGNQSTGQAITINRLWTAADVLVIDCNARTVTVNGTPTDFTGAFPIFLPGAGELTYLDNLTARNFNINATYYVMYL